MVERRFVALMGPALRRAADDCEHVVYGAWSDGVLAYQNPAWKHMALANGGDRLIEEWTVGRNVWDAIPDVIAPFYREQWRRALETGVAQESDYECSSPREQRVYRMRIEPLHGEGLIVRNDLQVASVHAPGDERAMEDYRAPSGYVAMCANCRRTRRLGSHDGWDWVPALVEQPPPSVTHGICRLCLELYYPVRTDD